MSIIGNPIIHVLLTFYDGVFFSGSILALTLTLTGYDIRKNIIKVLLLCCCIAAGMTVPFYLPQLPRTIIIILVVFISTKFVLGFSIKMTFIVSMIFWALAMVFVMVIGLTIVEIINISPIEYLSTPFYRLFTPTLVALFNILMIIISYKLNLCAPEDLKRMSLNLGFVSLPILQLAILMFIINENYLRYINTEKNLFLFFSIAISLTYFVGCFFIWRIMLISLKDARVTANNSQIAQIEEKIYSIRAHRHDFINHVQIIMVILEEKKTIELRKYITKIKSDITT